MSIKLLVGVLCVAFLSGFQPSALRWRSPTVIVLRFVAEGMPAGMYDAAVKAARMWHNESMTIVIAPDDYAGKVQGVIRYGGALALGRGIMGTMLRMGTESHALVGCDVQVRAGEVPWHTGIEAPGPEQADAITDFAHEFGHCLGLLHEDGATPPALMRAHVRYGEYHRVLPLDDAQARDLLFPPSRRSLGLFGCGKRV